MNRDDLEAATVAAMASGDWRQVHRLAPLLDEAYAARPGGVALVSAALWYAEQGLPVFPCAPGSKVPAKGSAGCKDATTDPERIRAWWAAAPTSNVAIATGHLVDVVDFDGARAHQAWGEVFPDRTDLVPSAELVATVSTPRPGGLHAYVKTRGHGNRAAMVPGVDYRGAGGYVLAPPSVTDLGAYVFLRPFQPGLAAWT